MSRQGLTTDPLYPIKNPIYINDRKEKALLKSFQIYLHSSEDFTKTLRSWAEPHKKLNYNKAFFSIIALFNTCLVIYHKTLTVVNLLTITSEDITFRIEGKKKMLKIL